MQRLQGGGIVAVAGLLKRQKNECDRNRALSNADSYRSMGGLLSVPLFAFCNTYLYKTRKHSF